MSRIWNWINFVNVSQLEGVKNSLKRCKYIAGAKEKIERALKRQQARLEKRSESEGARSEAFIRLIGAIAITRSWIDGDASENQSDRPFKTTTP